MMISEDERSPPLPSRSQLEVLGGIGGFAAAWPIEIILHFGIPRTLIGGWKPPRRGTSRILLLNPFPNRWFDRAIVGESVPGGYSS